MGRDGDLLRADSFSSFTAIITTTLLFDLLGALGHFASPLPRARGEDGGVNRPRELRLFQ